MLQIIDENINHTFITIQYVLELGKKMPQQIQKNPKYIENNWLRDAHITFQTKHNDSAL
jgi:hypothetical protein